MKQKLLKTMLLLFTLIAGVNFAWADEVTYTFTSKSWTATSGGSAANWTSGKDGAGFSNNGIQVTTSATGANGTSPESFSNITEIVLTYNTNKSKGAGTAVVQIGENESDSQNWAYSSGDGTSANYTLTYSYDTPQSGNVKITLNTTTNSIYLVSCKITYGGGGDTPTTYSVTYNANGATSGDVPTDNTEYEEYDEVTVLGNTGDLAKTGCAFGGWNTQANGEGDDYDEDDTFIITANTTLYAKWNPYTITAVSNNESYGTVSLNGSVITATPATGYTYASPAYTVNPANSATVVQDGNTFTVTPTADTEVTINFETLPTYTVTFSDGGTLTQETAGAEVTLPSRESIGDYAFVGWSETNVAEETTTAPTIIPAGGYTPTANITLYPVYSKTEGGGGTVNKTASVNIGTYASEQGWVNGTQYETVTLDENVTATADGGSNTGKYYSSNSSWRLYANESAELIIALEGGTLSSVTITYSGNKLTYNGEDVTSGTSVNVSGNSATFAVSGSSSNSQVTAIEVNYTISGGGTTYYWSTPVAAAVARPVITVEENPFLFSTTVTITCDTEDATIKYSFDGENWSDYTEALTITATTTISAKAVKDNDESQVATVTATKNLAVPTVTIDATGITNTDVYDGTEAGSLAASVTYNEAAVTGAAVTWKGDNDEVATIDEESGEVTLVGAGSVTFTATYAGNDDYAEKTATYEMTVTNSDPNVPGTENNPYTVAQAKEATPATGTSANVYISGIVSAFYAEDIMSDGSNYRYYISDDGTTDNQLLIYKGNGLNNKPFSSANDLQIGDAVVILGGLTTYRNDPEVAAGNYIVSLERPVNTDPAIAVSPATVNATAAETDGTVAITYENLTISDKTDFAVQFYDAEGEEADEPDWMAVEVTEDNGDYVVSYVIDANTSTEARTAYFKVLAMDEDFELVYSNLVTVTQAGYVVDYATLPFEWDSKDTPTGITNNGVSTYNSSPYLKFDGTGDEIILKLNEEPAMLYFDIKGNCFSGGTFTVQTSADGVNYADLETYDDLGSTQTEAFSLDANVRYIKWVYTEKSSGNVALGNIIVDKAETFAIGAAGYTTYVTKHNVAFPAEVEAYIVTTVNKEKNAVLLTQVGAAPKGTPVILKNNEEEAGTYSLTPAASGSLDDVADNLLLASDGTVEGDGTIFALSKKNNDVGFYRVNDGVTVPEGKAYLVVSDTEVKGFTFVFDDATGISATLNDKGQMINDNIYNLAGQRISKMQRGVNIVNGKKLLK